MRPILRRLAPLAFAAAAALVFSACGNDVEIKIDSINGGYHPAPGSLAMSTMTPEGMPVDAQITSSLVQLAENHGNFTRDLSTATSGTPEGDILLVGSPMGYNLRNRFLNLGIPLAEAFAQNSDPVFRQQLIEMSRWDANSESRAAALIALARWHDLSHLQIFNEALINLDPGVRFAALESLVVWNHPREAMVLLAAASEKDTEPILRVYAAAGLARLGDPAGLARLRLFLDDPSWLIRALAAKYIGENGTAEDYSLLLNRIDSEVDNDFVVAEFCVSALKLYPKKKAADLAAVPSRPVLLASKPVDNGNLVMDEDMAYQLDPLVVTAPREAAQADLIDPRIDNQLLRLLKKKSERLNPTQQSDPSLTNLFKLTTETGYNLQTRYTQLGFLLTEGLAGSSDYLVQTALENSVRVGKDPQIRAAAITALAYTKDMRFLQLFQGAIIDPNITVRFAALEALLILGDPSVEMQVGNAARGDPSLPIQIYGAAAMWKMGDIFGHEYLLRMYQNPDWLVRAMSDHYLGELGDGDAYRRLQSELDGENDPAVKAEILDALVKLNPKKDQ